MSKKCVDDSVVSTRSCRETVSDECAILLVGEVFTREADDGEGVREDILRVQIEECGEEFRLS